GGGAWLKTMPSGPVGETGSVLGHGFEPQFAMNIALATLALGREKLFPAVDSSGVEREYEGPLERVAVTAVGHWRGEGMALVEAVAWRRLGGDRGGMGGRSGGAPGGARLPPPGPGRGGTGPSSRPEKPASIASPVLPTRA